MPPRVDIGPAAQILGWMSPEELTWLARQATHARTIVEIGSFVGRSTRALADHCRGVVYAIDPWEGYCNDDGSQAKWIEEAVGGGWTQILERFTQNLGDHLDTGRVVAIRQRSSAAVDMLKAHLGPRLVDLAFVDGDHRYEACRPDITLYRPLVRPGGILAGHDYGRRDWPGVKRAVDELVGPVNRCGSIWWVTV